MSTMRISQLAGRSGVPATAITLRFYESAGLSPADRSPAGHRLYGEGAVERLAFVGAAKHLGLPLEEVAGGSRRRRCVADTSDGTESSSTSSGALTWQEDGRPMVTRINAPRPVPRVGKTFKVVFDPQRPTEAASTQYMASGRRSSATPSRRLWLYWSPPPYSWSPSSAEDRVPVPARCCGLLPER
ncbi:MerR family transcriptional regulator [Streptomyces roseolus]|uniref:MerR family transcriptional regulator n=1 Tax=Streptomyces roseolus TaxID=67358 RepID=UPI003570A5A1